VFEVVLAIQDVNLAAVVRAAVVEIKRVAWCILLHDPVCTVANNRLQTEKYITSIT
jgi:hypothetical protein